MAESEKPKRNYDLEVRLVRFSSMIGELATSLIKTKEATNLSSQLIRSAQSAALNYGEAQVAESIMDFIHKIGVTLKELKESRVSIKIIILSNLTNEVELVNKCDNECSELIAIFITSVRTAKKNPLAKKMGI